MNKLRNTLSFLLAATLVIALPAQEKYSKPPKAIEDVMTAPLSPTVSVSPTRDYMMLEQGQRNPSIADLAEPMLRLAGLRINPRTNGPHREPRIVGLTLKKIGGSEVKIAMPAGAKLSAVSWSEDGKHFAFTNTTHNGIELWTGVTATGSVSKAPGVALNTACSAGGPGGGGGGRGGFGGGGGGPVRWIHDGKELFVRTVPAGRGKAPATDAVPDGPDVQQSLTGTKGQVATLEDLLKTQQDEKLYEYYCTAQLSIVDPAAGKVTVIGKPGIFSTADISPDGKHFLVARIHRPYSYLYSQQAFPKDVEVWNAAGKVEYTLAKVPLADTLPLEAVQTGPRGWQWHPLEPATLVWTEALDGGKTREPAKERDKVVKLAAPFTASPAEIVRTEQRFGRIQWTQSGKYAIFSDSEGGRRRSRTFLMTEGGKPELLWSLDQRERYKNPGTMMTKNVHGHNVIVESNGVVLLDGLGSSPEGDHPFLDRFDLTRKKSERIFQCDNASYEQATTLLDDTGSRFITRWETPKDPPNYFVRSAGGEKKALTSFPDLTPQIRGIKAQLVKYKRPDGVDLNFTLYLPPDYKEGTRLPTFIWAYPYEYDDAATASQVSGSDKRFTLATGRLVLPLAGYAVLDNTAMPVVGDSRVVNDHFVEQIVADAKAAIDKAVEMGVTDRNRVGVGGHSYGAFMTGNLLANSDLFKAGVAESGAYNRTLTPLGFQSERRTYWEASSTYLNMSPFHRADKIKTPMLMIHGEADDNSGTFPIQSERLYQAIKGNGGRARLVMLPHEAHGYQAKETILHVVYETLTWLDRYVKGDGESGGAGSK